MWLSSDPDALQNYRELPSPLQLSWVSRFLNASPTGWVTVLRSGVPGNPHSTITSVLVAEDDVPKMLSTRDWDDDCGSAWNWAGDTPGFADGMTSERDDYTMHFFAQARSHNGYVDRSIDLTPSLVWWLGLFRTGDGCWGRLDSAGRFHEVVLTTRNSDGSFETKIDANYLRRYLAARKMVLVLQHRHTVWADYDGPRIDMEHMSDDASFEFVATSSVGGTTHDYFSDVLGKSVVRPFDRVGDNPDDTFAPERFQDFIVGVDEASGAQLRWTCKVAEDIGHTPQGEPNYLTPVYFNKEVLTRYRDDTRTYVLARSRLWCLNLWGLDFDVNDADLVQLWLGDIGRQLPESERDHWLTHNVSPRGGVTESRFRRDVLNQWDVEDDRPDLDNLRRARRRLDAAVHAKFGLHLYRPLGEHDQREFDGLALCTNDSVGQRDLSFLTLTKGVVDAIDVKAVRQLADADKAESSLNAYQAWVQKLGGDVEEIVGPLRLLQNLRSTGSAHLKGSRYAATMAAEGWDSLPHGKQFQDMVQRVTTALEQGARLIENSPDSSTA